MKQTEEWKQEWRKLKCDTLAEHEANATFMINQIQRDAFESCKNLAALECVKYSNDMRGAHVHTGTTSSEIKKSILASTLNDQAHPSEASK